MRTAILLIAGGLLIAVCHWLDARPRSLPAAGPRDDRPQTVKVAAVQCSSDLGAVEVNRRKLTGLVREAAANGAKIVVLPETAVTGYLSQDLQTNWHLKGRPLNEAFVGRDPTPDAEAVPGPSTDHFCKLARELGVYLTVKGFRPAAVAALPPARAPR